MDTNTNKSFAKSLLEAFLFFLYKIVYILFIVPFDLWKNAVLRLAKAKENKSLSITKINSEFPYFTFIKRVLIDFLMDTLILIAPIVIVIALFSSIRTYFYDYSYYYQLSYFDKYYNVVVTILIVYILYTPILIFVKDFIILSIMPIKKFISWLKKTAQYIDINHSVEIKNKQ